MKWLLLIVATALATLLPLSDASAQCGPGGCGVYVQPSGRGTVYGRSPAMHVVPPKPNQPQPAFRIEVPDGYKRSVVRIYAFEGATRRSVGSGAVIIWKNRKLILTAWHVVKDAMRVGKSVGKLLVIPFKGKQTNARLLSHDPDYDVAVLAVDDETVLEAAEPEFGEEAIPKPGERVESCGYGPNGEFAVNVGTVLRYTRPSTRAVPPDWMVLSGKARQGDSGGPVFNRRGRLVGVLWGTDGREVLATQSGRVQLVLNAGYAKLPAAPVQERKPLFPRLHNALTEAEVVPVPMPEADRPSTFVDTPLPQPPDRAVDSLAQATVPNQGTVDEKIAVEIYPSCGILDKLRERRNPTPPPAQPAPPYYYGQPTQPPNVDVQVGKPPEKKSEEPKKAEMSPWWLLLFIPLSIVTMLVTIVVAHAIHVARQK